MAFGRLVSKRAWIKGREGVESDAHDGAKRGVLKVAHFRNRIEDGVRFDD
jgi:hypothetical protein